MIEVSNTLKYLEIDCQTTDVRRMGSYQQERMRTIVFNVANPWNKTDFTMIKKEHDKPVYVSRELAATEAKIEALALKKREELIDDGRRDSLRTRDLEKFTPPRNWN